MSNWEIYFLSEFKGMFDFQLIPVINSIPPIDFSNLFDAQNLALKDSEWLEDQKIPQYFPIKFESGISKQMSINNIQNLKNPKKNLTHGLNSKDYTCNFNTGNFVIYKWCHVYCFLYSRLILSLSCWKIKLLCTRRPKKEKIL